MDTHKVPSAVQVVLKGTLLFRVYDVVGRHIGDHEKEDGVIGREIAISKRRCVFCLVEFYIMRGTGCLEGVDRIRDGFLEVGADRRNEFQGGISFCRRNQRSIVPWRNPFVAEKIRTLAGCAATMNIKVKASTGLVSFIVSWRSTNRRMKDKGLSKLTRCAAIPLGN